MLTRILELTILRGYLDKLPFVDWIPRLTHAKYNVLSRADMLASARLGVVEMLHAGVTCVGEVMDLGTAWDAMREFGLQGIAYQEVFGPAESQAMEAMAGLREKIQDLPAGRERNPACRRFAARSLYGVRQTV